MHSHILIHRVVKGMSSNLGMLCKAGVLFIFETYFIFFVCGPLGHFIPFRHLIHSLSFKPLRLTAPHSKGEKKKVWKRDSCPG